MDVRSSGATRRPSSALVRSVLVIALMGAIGPVSAGPQHGGAAGNQRPAQPVGNLNPYAAATARGRYTPSPIKDSSAAERALLAGRAYRTALDDAARLALTPPRPGGPPDEAALFPPELAERLGRWSLRWLEAQDNAARSLAARYQAVSEHLGRMSSLEDGRSVREAAMRAGAPTGRAAEPMPPRLFVDIARFFRPIDEWGMDRVVPELVEVERPLNRRRIAVTPGERVEIAGRVYRTILDEAVARSLASRPAGPAGRDVGAIFDAVLAERLGTWSDLWRQAEDDAVTDPASRSAAVRNRSARPVWAGARLADTDSRPATIRSHIERMAALEDGRFWHDALERAGRPADGRVDMGRLREFAEVVRFFRIEGECQLLGGSRPNDPGATSSGRAAAAGRIYREILDEAARRYAEAPRGGGVPPDAGLVFDPRLAERLGTWSIRWGRAQAGAGDDRAAQFKAIRSHIERMASLEDGRSLNEALARAGRDAVGSAAPAPPRAFADVAQFFRLQALWEMERIKSR